MSLSERCVRLKAPPGVVGVEYGGEIFIVKDGYVLVPIMAEPALTRTGTGFVFPDEPKVIHARQEVKTLKVRR